MWGTLGAEGGSGGQGLWLHVDQCCCHNHIIPPEAGGDSFWIESFIPSPTDATLHWWPQNRPAMRGKGGWATAPACLTGSRLSPQTTYKGKSSFQTYSDYLRWESFLQQQLQAFPEGSALRRGFQTCEHWKQIFMEIVGKQQPRPLHPGWAGGRGTWEGRAQSGQSEPYSLSWPRALGKPGASVARTLIRGWSLGPLLRGHLATFSNLDFGHLKSNSHDHDGSCQLPASPGCLGSGLRA